MKNLILMAFFIFCLSSSVACAEPGKNTDISLACPVSGHYLDGETIKNHGEESIIVLAKGEAARADITSNEKKFEASVISHNDDYLILAYGNMVRKGLDTNLVTGSYMIDLQTKKFRRTLSFFPSGKVWSLDGQCRQL